MILVYTNARGESITLGPPPYQLINEGTENTDASNQWIKSPYQNGSSYVDTLLENTVLPLTLRIRATSNEDLQAKKQWISRVLNPKLGIGELKKVEFETVRFKKCVPSFVPEFPKGQSERAVNSQLASIQFEGSPFWESETAESELAFKSLFEFPFEGEFEMGLQQEARIINNDGDVEAPIKIEFYGPVTNPVITNTQTGEFIKVNREVPEGSILKVDTTFGDISVIIESESSEENALNWITLDSTFFYLKIGNNLIDYTADSNVQGTRVDMFWRNLYVGV